MEFIRSETQNRTLLSILFISLLCLLLISVSTLIYAGGPLLILGVPAVVFVKKAVGLALGGLTIWGTVEMLNKDLDEQITNLEDEIVDLTIAKRSAIAAQKEAQKEEASWKEKRNTARNNVSAEKSIVSTAKADVAMAKSAYDSSLPDYYRTYDSLRMHVHDECSQCTSIPSNMCSEGHRLYNLWQAEASTVEANKADWNAKKDALKEKENVLSDAWTVYYEVGGTYGQYALAFELAKNTADAAQLAVDTKSGELAAKKVEKSIHDATIQNALGQTSSAIDELDAAETHYPDAWSEAMSDPDLAAQVQEVRDAWSEKNGGQ